MSEVRTPPSAGLQAGRAALVVAGLALAVAAAAAGQLVGAALLLPGVLCAGYLLVRRSGLTAGERRRVRSRLRRAGVLALGVVLVAVLLVALSALVD